MSKALMISLIIFSVTWAVIIFRCVRKGRLSIKYSLVWFMMSFILFLVGIIPKFIELIADFFGFITIANLVIGIILTLLLLITLILTMIVTNQKTQIKNLTQEISIIKSNISEGKRK